MRVSALLASTLRTLIGSLRFKNRYLDMRYEPGWIGPVEVSVAIVLQDDGVHPYPSSIGEDGRVASAASM